MNDIWMPYYYYFSWFSRWPLPCSFSELILARVELIVLQSNFTVFASIEEIEEEETVLGAADNLNFIQFEQLGPWSNRNSSAVLLLFLLSIESVLITGY